MHYTQYKYKYTSDTLVASCSFRLFSWTRKSYECSEIKRFAPFAVAKAIPTDTELTNHIFVQKHLPHFGLKKQKKINKIGTKKYNTILELVNGKSRYKQNR
ncbi:Neuroligin-2 [Aphis craccivora]|uniref:Neuroligin-2 n=1 Tax=Aphis craccivora TaxID=307492 RepID=A0A6G0Z5T8_APHCR|nr:Neuroligin-2 [Aphis craccivora]